MTWSYSDPSSSDKDAVRFLVGDTDTTDQIVSNEEILYALGEFPDPYFAAASVAESIASKFAREITHSGDGLSFSGDQLSKHYSEMAERLRHLAKRRRRGGVVPYAGGLSWHEREKDDADEDLIKTSFRSHMHDHPQTKTRAQDPLKGESS